MQDRPTARPTFVAMDTPLPEVVLTVTASVDGRVTLGRHQRLLEAGVAERWAWGQARDAFASRHQEIDARVVLEGSGSFVDVAAATPRWPPPTTPEDELWRDHVPHRSSSWFVVADGRGRVDWTLHRGRDHPPARPGLSGDTAWLPATTARPRRGLLRGG